jgi:hypothetical protein
MQLNVPLSVCSVVVVGCRGGAWDDLKVFRAKTDRSGSRPVLSSAPECNRRMMAVGTAVTSALPAGVG